MRIRLSFAILASLSLVSPALGQDLSRQIVPLRWLEPFLVTPPVNPGSIHLEDVRRSIGRIVVPVDLSAASLHQTQVARGLAEALSLPLVLRKFPQFNDG